MHPLKLLILPEIIELKVTNKLITFCIHNNVLTHTGYQGFHINKHMYMAVHMYMHVHACEWINA